MIKAVLFDFDGVLTLDATGSQSIINYVTGVTGVDRALFEKEYRKYNNELLYGKLKHEEVWGQICTGIGREIDIKVLYDSFINTPIDFEMLNLVKKLKDNNYRIGMITDNKKDRIEDISEYHNFNSLFDVITVSAAVGFGKEGKEIFEITLDNLGLKPEECVFIDNTEKNLVAPKHMGMEAVFYDHKEKDLDKLVILLKGLAIEV